MMALLKDRVCSLVYDYLNDDNMESGYNTTTIEEDDLAIEIECYNDMKITGRYGGYDEQPYCVGVGRVIPKKVIVYPIDENGDSPCCYDITSEISAYVYKF